MSLEDVGKKVMFYPDSMMCEPSEKEVVMVIRTPRGEIRLFATPEYRGRVVGDITVEAIRAFMAEHYND